MTLNHGVKISILDLLVSSSLKLVFAKMKAIIVLTIHSTSFSQADSFEADLAEGSFHSIKEVGKRAWFCLCCSVNLSSASDVAFGMMVVDASSFPDICLSLDVVRLTFRRKCPSTEGSGCCSSLSALPMVTGDRKPHLFTIVNGPLKRL